MNQNTVKTPFHFEGIGLHTGQFSKVTVKPAVANSGIRFVRVDLEGSPQIPADVDLVSDTRRSTSIKKGIAEVKTIEHILSALYGMNIDNAVIEIDGLEVPIMEGSAKVFTSLIANAGIEEQSEPAQVLCIDDHISFTTENDYSTYDAVPCSTFEVTAMVDFESHIVSAQHAGYKAGDDYTNEIAGARTFVFWHDLEILFKNGLIKGGSLDNAVTIINSEVSEAELNNIADLLNIEASDYTGPGIYAAGGLQFANEPARHKVLDLLGDLALIGVRICGKIIAEKPGHAANVAFAKKLKSLWKEQKKLPGKPKYDPNQTPVYIATDLERILPHRYPFLLVDKIIEVTDKQVVGIKNVTFNEQFFQGHFPGNPVMPGVLQIEALAQTGGILALNTVEDPENWDTYFIKIDRAKFKTKVIPGDTLILKMELLSPIRRGICHMYGTAYVGNKIASEGEFMAQIVRQNRT